MTIITTIERMREDKERERERERNVKCITLLVH